MILKGSSGQITGSDVLFDGGKIAGWSISSTTLTSNGGGIRLNGNGNNSEISINSHTFGNEGIQLGFNSGSPRFYAGNGGNNFLRYDTSNGVNIKTTKITLDATTLFIDSETNSGMIGLGTDGSAMTHGATGIYLDGTGKFSFVEDSSNFIKGGNSNFEIQAENFHLLTSTLRVSSSAGGSIALGTTPPSNLSSNGIFSVSYTHLTLPTKA